MGGLWKFGYLNELFFGDSVLVSSGLAVMPNGTTTYPYRHEKAQNQGMEDIPQVGRVTMTIEPSCK